MKWRNLLPQASLHSVSRNMVCTSIRLVGVIKNYKRDRRGSIIAIFALTTPVLLMIAGFSLDYGMALVQKKRLQAAVDAGAIAAAKEFTLVNSEDNQLQIIAASAVKANLMGKGPTPKISVSVSTERMSVQLTAVQDVKTYFGGVYGDKINRVRAEAEAIVVGSTRICVLALDPENGGAVSLEQSARITGNGCAVYSNSSNENSIKAKNYSRLSASLTCSVGGYSGDASNFEPEPLTDCPAFADPLADRPEPDAGGGCLETDLVIVDKVVTLSPGIYCGGIQISGSSDVSMNSGIYIIKDGPLTVDGNSIFAGENVGLFLTGAATYFHLGQYSTIDLTAPEDGAMAGLLFFGARSQPNMGTHKIASNNARLLLGTIYLPNSKLIVDANSPIADQSAYTAIVVKTLKLFSGPNLVLNTDYAATEIPVPDGIRGVGNEVTLAK